MKDYIIQARLLSASYDELTDDDRQLVDRAKAMTTVAYQPYSHFGVGAALLLRDGSIFVGCNQENAAFGAGICAERSAFFAAGAAKPDVPPVAIAIAAQNADGFLPLAVAPCGICRQALTEAEVRFQQPIRVILYGTDQILIASSMQDLLPLNFDNTSLKY